jgi:hypothetical protein
LIKRCILLATAACVAVVFMGCGSGSPTKSDSGGPPPAINKTGGTSSGGGAGTAPPPPPPPPLPGKG